MQEKTDNIELFLVSGFLGSGKTTFLRNVLEGEDNKKIGVIINEFGSVSIDEKILKNDDVKLVEINNGSIFCACLKGGFVKTLAAFLQQPIDRLYIEASGMADPSSMEELLKQMVPLLQKKYATNRRYCYRGSICIVDAGNFIDLSSCLLPVISQVKKSGLIVLNKKDTVSEAGLRQLHEELRKLNPDAYIYDTSYSMIPEEVLNHYLQGEIDNVDESYNTSMNRPFNGILTMPEDCETIQVKEFLNAICDKMIRMKGFYTANGQCMHVDCVADDIQIIADSGEKENKIVLIANTEENLVEWLECYWKKYFDTDMEFEVE